MPFRLHPLAALLIVALAACSDDPAVPATTTEPGTTTTALAPTTTEPPAGAMPLSYSLQPGSVLEYLVTIEQRIDLAVAGDPELIADEDLPASAVIEVTGATTLTYAVEEGTQPGTYRVTIRGEFDDFEVSGTVDGEPIDAGEAPEFAASDPIDVTIVVDEQGRLVQGEEVFGGWFDGDLFDFDHPGLDLGRLVGPPFPDEDVAVGDSWSETFQFRLLMGDDPVTTTIDSRVARVETLDGAEVMVIETTTSTPLIEVDLAEFYIGFFRAFVPDDVGDEDLAELEEALGQIRFVMRLEPTVDQGTTWFDPLAGLARRATHSGMVRLVLDINLPDEETGELVAFDMLMTMDQNVTFTLSSPPGS